MGITKKPNGEELETTPLDQGDGSVASKAELDSLVRAIADILRTGGTGVTIAGLSATAKAEVNAEVDTALDTAIPGAPTADSINERIETLDDNYTATRAGYLDELAAANLPADLDAALVILNALPVLTTTSGTVTGAGGGEQDIVINATPAGVFKPRKAKISLDNMQGGDTTVFRVYAQLLVGGALELVDYVSYTGADGGLLNGTKVIEIDLSENRYGIQVTLDETAGGTRDYPWDYFYEA